MSLKRLLRDERGTLYEIPLLIVFVLLGLALVPAWHSWWKAFLGSGLMIVGVLGALVGLGLAADKASDLAELGPVRRALDSRPARALGALLAYAAGGVLCAVPAAFVSLFVAPHLSSTAAGQLLAMRAFTAAGGVAGLAVVFAARR